MLKLYDYIRSSAAFRVRLALNYKQLAYEKLPVNLLHGEQSSTEYLAINPSGLVPSLKTEDGVILTQSLAIIEYLDETYPDMPLLPKDKLARTYVRGLALDIACDIHPLNNLRVLNYLRKNLKHHDEEVNHWYQHWIAEGLKALEAKIVTSGYYTGKCCYQEQFTLADICLIPQLFNARRFNCNLDSYPSLCAIEEMAKKESWVTKAFPT